jgi:hypothetical protein
MSASTNATPLDKKSQPNFKKSKPKLRRSNAFYGGGSDRVVKPTLQRSNAFYGGGSDRVVKDPCDGCGAYDCTDKNCYDRYNYESAKREEDWDW